MDVLRKQSLDAWLAAYGAAWEARDPGAAARLFAADALYFWTPFGPPKRGQGEIAAAWEQATARQRDIRFKYEIWSVSDMRAVAHWHTKFTRIATGLPVEIDGVLLAEFDPAGACRLFREWWHSSEAG